MALVGTFTSEHNSNDTNDDVHGTDPETDNDETNSLVKDSANMARPNGRTVSRQCSREEEIDNSNEIENRTDQLEEEDYNIGIVDENIAPDGGWGWFIVIGALLLRTVLGGIGKSHGLFYIQFKEKFNGTATSTALVTSLTFFIRLSAGPAVSILSGRFKSRVLTSFGTVVSFLGLILTAFSPNLQFLFFSFGVVTGFGRAFSLTPVPILLGYYFNKRRSLAFGVASAGFSIGGFVVPPIAELLFQNYGYQGTFLILSGFALNILVSSALFRPIELHRKLTSPNRNSKKSRESDSSEVNPLVFKSLEQIESGGVLNSSTASINRLHVKSNGANNSSASSPNQPEPPSDFSGRSQSPISQDIMRDKMQNASFDSKQTNGKETKKSILTTKHTKSTAENSAVDSHNGAIGENEQGKSDKEEPFLQTNKTDRDASIEDSEVASKKSCKWCCFKGRTLRGSETKKKNKLISWSVLKDRRFQCLVFATFCFTLSSHDLFMPALAKTKGVSELQAATLLSACAGCDTVFRVLSGIVLDLKIFRSIRPLIYNSVTFLQGIIAGLYPLMTNYSEFLALSAIDGTVQGIKYAQEKVVMMDLLGVDKLASSMAVTMAVQCVAVFLGPTVSGQLIDNYGSYNGAFYFGSGAILLGGLVMAAGNIAKHCTDRKAKASLDSSSERSTNLT